MASIVHVRCTEDLVKVAIPHFGDSIAPRLEAAGSFIIAAVEGQEVTARQAVTCAVPEGHKRVRLLQVHRADVVICSGIKRLYQDMLTASGVTVIKDVTGSVEGALERFMAGELTPELPTPDELSEAPAIAHRDLVDWVTRCLEENGYSVTPPSESNYSLVDLVAEIRCPVCGRQVRVAVCCGSHTYRPTQEISEFHHATPTGFHAKVYVCPANPAIVTSCQEYGIELLDPESWTGQGRSPRPNKLPVLRGPVPGHERASYAGVD
jgi:predicted Fe-Mo cluster-binding NifX family protein